MRKQFTNKEILTYADLLNRIFLQEDKNLELPIRVNFYLQKNIKTFIEAAELIEESRMAIGRKYGEFNTEEESYLIKDEEKLLAAKQDLKNLFSLEQVLEIYPIDLEDLEDTKLTVAQMNAMLFMIEE